MKGLPYKAVYLKGHAVAKMNPNGVAISKLVTRCSSNHEAVAIAKQRNLLYLKESL